MRGGRGQVTVFVLVGLVILIVLILIYALARRFSNIPVATDGYDTQAVKGHIEQCMDLVAEDAFTLLGTQGGRLYQSQGGLQSDVLAAAITPRGGGIPVTVGFGLMNDSGFPLRPKFASQYMSANEYPYPFPYTNILQLYPVVDTGSLQHTWHQPRYDGAFGQDALPLPCENGGANTKDGTLRCARHLYPLPSQGVSVQASLEAFFTYKLMTCIQIDELATLLGTSVEAEEPNVTVTFTSSETAVELELPLSFSDETGSFKTGVFTRRYKARTYPLFAFAHQLLDRASKDPFFRINNTTDLATLSLNDGFVVTQTRLPPEQTSDRDDLFLVTIADAKSQVDKGAWFLSFLVQNRRPVLGYLDPFTLTQGEANVDDILIIDPDGDNLMMTIDGNLGLDTLGLEVEESSSSFTFDYTVTLTAGFLAIPDTYSVNLTVTDSAGLVDWQTVDITIEEFTP